jgi:Ca2+-binding EF-hand superfamily protein
MKRIPSIALFAALALAALAAPAPAQTVPPATDFKALDTDRDGRVSLDEVMACALKQSSLTRPFRVDEVDRDRDGRLTREEFLRAGIEGLERYGVIDVRELDANGDGYVSREELDEFFRNRHRQEFARVDADRDGTLRPAEFALFRF